MSRADHFKILIKEIKAAMEDEKKTQKKGGNKKSASPNAKKPTAERTRKGRPPRIPVKSSGDEPDPDAARRAARSHVIADSKFNPDHIFALAIAGNLRALERAAKALTKWVQEFKPYSDKANEWAKVMPMWRSVGHNRQRLGWGQTRDPHGNIVDKAGALPRIQRAAVLKAITFYVERLGYPPVVAGM